MRLVPSLLVIALLATAGCRSGDGGWAEFLSGRARDFGECFVGSLHAGGLAAAQARCGPVGIGAGLYLSSGFGKAHWWDAPGAFVWADAGLGVIHGIQDGSLGPDEYGRTAIAGLTFLTNDRRIDGVPPPVGEANPNPPVLPPPHWIVDRFFSIEVGGYAILGARVGFNLAEFADFVVGWFGAELVSDFEKTREAFHRDWWKRHPPLRPTDQDFGAPHTPIDPTGQPSK